VRFMLDTDICIYIIKQRPPSVAARFRELAAEDLCISAITYAELMNGAKKSAQVEANIAKLGALARELSVLSFDMAAAVIYGDVRSRLERDGQVIGASDLLIAAHALQCGLILVTNNEREFRRVRGLRVENWAEEVH
jgi:tRNA(fMet)-specific endonuclease VapC